MATPGSQQDFVVNVGDRVFFDTDSTDLSPTARATLDKQAQWLTNYSQYSQFTIEGHADERGTREYNIALGARRAQAVRDYLASRGIAANRMRTISYGKERPVAVCNDISCWSQNRRAVTVLGASS
jgi:peptidoglycan-associated lipoprotein